MCRTHNICQFQLFLGIALFIYALLVNPVQSHELPVRMISDRTHNLAYRLPIYSAQDWKESLTDKDKKYRTRVEGLALAQIDYARIGKDEFSINVRVLSPKSMQQEEALRRNLIKLAKGKFVSAKPLDYRGQPTLVMKYEFGGILQGGVEERVFFFKDKLVSVRVLVDARAANFVSPEVAEMFESIRFFPQQNIEDTEPNNPQLIDTDIGLMIRKLPSFRISMDGGLVRIRSWSKLNGRELNQTVILKKQKTPLMDYEERKLLHEISKRGGGDQTYSRKFYKEIGYERYSVFQRGNPKLHHKLYELMVSDSLTINCKTSIKADDELPPFHTIQQERRRWSPVEPVEPANAKANSPPQHWNLKLIRPDTQTNFQVGNRKWVGQILDATEGFLRQIEMRDFHLLTVRRTAQDINGIMRDANRSRAFDKDHLRKLAIELHSLIFPLKHNQIQSPIESHYLSKLLGDLILCKEIAPRPRAEFERCYRSLELGPNDQLQNYFIQLLAATRSSRNSTRGIKRRKNSNIRFVSLDPSLTVPSVNQYCEGRFLNEFQNIHVRIELLKKAAMLGEQAIPILVEVMTWNDYPLLKHPSRLDGELGLGRGHSMIARETDSSAIGPQLLKLNAGTRYFVLQPNTLYDEAIRFSQRRIVMTTITKLLDELLKKDKSLESALHAQILIRTFSPNALAIDPTKPVADLPIYNFGKRLAWDRESMAHLTAKYLYRKGNANNKVDMFRLNLLKLLLEKAEVVKKSGLSAEELKPTVAYLAQLVERYIAKIKQANTILGPTKSGLKLRQGD